MKKTIKYTPKTLLRAVPKDCEHTQLHVIDSYGHTKPVVRIAVHRHNDGTRLIVLHHEQLFAKP